MWFRRSFLSFLWLCLLGYSLGLIAQEQLWIEGLVESSEGVVSGAIVRCLEGKQQRAYTLTDQHGRFRLKLKEKPLGELRLSIRMMGFEPWERQVRLGEPPLKIRLKPQETALKEFIVKAPPVAQRGDTLRYRLSSFRSSGDYLLGDALKKLPGVEVSKEGAIKYLGKSISAFYIEGMDLLGGRYNLATSQLPAEDVSSVEIIENHKRAKIYEREHSDEVAINIKLASRAKLRPLGRSALETAWERERWRKEGSSSGMLFTPRWQLMASLRLGDLREFSRNMGVDHFSQGEMLESLSAGLQGALSSRPRILEADRYISPRDGMVHLNLLHKLSREETLKVQAGYTQSRACYHYETESRYQLEGSQLSIRERYTPREIRHEPWLSLSYKKDNKSFLLENQTKLNALQLSPQLSFDRNEIGSEHKAKRRELRLMNQLKLYFKKGSWYWGGSAQLSYTEQPRSRLEIFEGGSLWRSQALAERGFLGKLGLNLSHRKSYWSFSLPLSLSYQQRKISTSLEGVGTPRENQLLGDQFTLSLNPYYEYHAMDRRYILRLGLNNTLSAQHYRNQAPGEGQELRKLSYTPSPILYFLYKLSPSSALQLQYIHNRELGQLLDLATAPIQTHGASQQVASGVLDRVSQDQVLLRYDFKRPLELWFASLDVMYQHQKRQLLAGSVVSVEGIRQEKYQQPYHSQGLSLEGMVVKKLELLSSKLSLHGSMGFAWDRMRQNMQDYAYRGEYWRLVPEVYLEPWPILSLNYSYSIAGQGYQMDAERQHFLTQEHRFSSSLEPIENFRLSASLEVSRRELKKGQFKEMALLDLGLSYQWRAWRFSLGLNNLLDLRHYRYTLYEGINSYSYDYGLRGRQILLSITFTK